MTPNIFRNSVDFPVFENTPFHISDVFVICGVLSLSEFVSQLEAHCAHESVQANLLVFEKKQEKEQFNNLPISFIFKNIELFR